VPYIRSVPLRTTWIAVRAGPGVVPVLPRRGPALEADELLPLLARSRAGPLDRGGLLARTRQLPAPPPRQAEDARLAAARPIRSVLRRWPVPAKSFACRTVVLMVDNVGQVDWGRLPCVVARRAQRGEVSARR
jgi:hypothetical protein